MKKFLIILFIGHVLNFQIYSENLALDVEVDGILNRLSNLESKVTLSKFLNDSEKNISKILKDLEGKVNSKEQGRARELDERAINDFLRPRTKSERARDFIKDIKNFKNPFKKSQYQKDLSKLEKSVKSKIKEISKDIKSDLKNLNFDNFAKYQSKIDGIKNIVGDDLINQTNITSGIESQLAKMGNVAETAVKINEKINSLGLEDLFHGNKMPSYEGDETLYKISEFKRFLNNLPAEDKEIIKGTGLENAIKSFKSKMDTYTEFHEYHNSTSSNDDGLGGMGADGGYHGADIV